MARASIPSIMRADIQDWAESIVRMQDRSALGYGNRSTVGRMMDEGTHRHQQSAGAIVPTRGLDMPPHVQRIHDALKHTPASLEPVLQKCFIENKPPVKGERAKISYLCFWLHGYLAANR